MKTILATGANGQLGNSIRRLAAGYPQYAFVFTDVDTLDVYKRQMQGKTQTFSIRAPLEPHVISPL